MAVMDAILIPGAPRATKIAALAGSASSAEQLLGPRKLFLITGDGDFHLRFGQTGMDAATVADLLVPTDAGAVWDTGDEFTHIRVFNPGAGAINVYIMPLTRN